MPELAVILVNYRRPDDTVACIASLHRSRYTDFDIVVIDNASSDGSPELIESRCPGIHVIRNDTNLGFAGGNNIGLQQFVAGSYSYALLLNNDTEVDENTLSFLITATRAHPKAGILGAKIYYYDQPTLLWFAGGTLHPGSGNVLHRGRGEIDLGQYNTPGQTDFITGCCLLVKRDVINRIGMLDTDFFAYSEDVDFCLRAQRAGFELFYEPTARVWHKVSSTSQWDSPVYLYFTLRNRLILLRKNSTLLRSLPYFPQLVYFYGRQFIRLLFKWRDLPGARAAWFALVDGLLGRTGTLGRGRVDKLIAAQNGAPVPNRRRALPSR